MTHHIVLLLTGVWIGATIGFCIFALFAAKRSQR